MNIAIMGSNHQIWWLLFCAQKGGKNAVLVLGTRLQIMQNERGKKITSYREFDLTLQGKEKWAYFCITSDQDST